MKHITILAIALLPLFALAQTKADYEHAVSKFMKFYNASQPDNIMHMWPDDEYKDMGRMWNSETLATLHKDYGDMVSYKYFGIDTSDPGKVVVFKTVFTRSKHTMSLTMDKNGKLGTFRFKTSSDGIDKMLADEKAAKKG